MITDIPYIDILRQSLRSCRQSYLVGGTVRDLILNRHIRDYDIVLPDSPFKAAAAFANAINGAYVVLHERFPTARVVKGDYLFDFTSLKGGAIESDLQSRDFTINALAVSIFDPADAVIDETGGLSDINNRQIRMVSKVNLADDPLRMLRALRLAAELGFSIEPQTLSAIAALRADISRSAAERVWAELKMLLQAGSSLNIIKSAYETGLFFEILPELEPLVGLAQNRFHNLDVFDHTMAAYAEAEAVLNKLRLPVSEGLVNWLAMNPHKAALIKLAVLLHDVGKYGTQALSEDGQCSFHRHEELSTAITTGVLNRFKASAKETEFVTMLVENHMRILPLKRVGRDGLTTMHKSLIRLFNAASDHIYGLVILWIADSGGKPEATQQTIDICEGILEVYESQFLPRKSAPRFIRGKDLIETFKLTPSPLFGEILNAIELMILEGLIDSKEKAAGFVEEFLQKRRAAL